MINLAIESPIPLSEATKHRLLTKLGRAGGPPDYVTVWRWTKHGRNGVKLETVTTPRGLCTTEPAIVRFFNRLSQPVVTRPATRKQMQAAQDRTKAMLARSGI